MSLKGWGLSQYVTQLTHIMKAKIKNVLIGTLVAVIMAALLWFGFYPPSKERSKSYQLPGTELTVVEAETTYYEYEGVHAISYFLLLNEHGDTLAGQYAPFENVNGIVYMQGKGVYDCRDKAPAPLIEEPDEAIGPAFRIKAGNKKNEVVIVNLKTSREFLYDMDEKVLLVK